MHRHLLLSALLGLLAGGAAFAQDATSPVTSSSPAISPVPAAPSSPGSAPARSALPAPRFSSADGVSRSVLDLPPGATYTLTPTFTGLRVDVQNVQGAAGGGERPTPQLSGWRTVPTGAGATVTLLTPYPLGLSSGWHAFELPATSGDGHRLVVDFGATLEGGAEQGLQDHLQVVAAADPTAAVSATSVADVPAAPAPPAVSAQSITPVASPPPLAAAPTASGPVGTLGAPRIGKNPGFTRVVLDLPPGATYAATASPGGLIVLLRGVQVSADGASRVTGELSEWRYAPAAGGASLTLRTPFPLGAASGWRGQLLAPAAGSTRPRLVIDLSPAYADLTPLPASQRALAPIPPRATVQRASLGSAGATATPVPQRVVLDAGHGGVDPGAVGAATEKAVTLAIALRVRDLLRAAGAEVVMTRTTDTDLSDDKDTDLRMRAALGAPPAALFVSIHVNSMEKGSELRGYGVETWWYKNNPGSQALASHLQQDVVGATGNYSRGLQTGRALAVLRYSKVPAALVEVGFTSHPVDGQNLLNNNYLDRVAFGIAQGIRDSLPAQ